MHQASSAMWRSVSGLSKYHEILTFSSIFAKPGYMADTLLILALPSFRSFWLSPMSMLWLSPNCWSRSPDSKDLVRPLHRDRSGMHLKPAGWLAPCMVCGSSKQPTGLSRPRVLIAARVSSKNFKTVLSVVISCKRPAVHSKRSSTTMKCMASLTAVRLPLTDHH